MYYDEKSDPISYEEGDLVYIQNGSRIARSKLGPVRLGPFEIKKKFSDLIFVVNSGFEKKDSNIFHASKMIPYIPTPAAYVSSSKVAEEGCKSGLSQTNDTPDGAPAR